MGKSEIEAKIKKKMRGFCDVHYQDDSGYNLAMAFLELAAADILKTDDGEKNKEIADCFCSLGFVPAMIKQSANAFRVRGWISHISDIREKIMEDQNG